ncbi:MAG: hypothetical protein IKT50_00935 [Clostridia bacterium]|nr:hypothetical protein [Clostridia bacterium]
MSKYIKKCISFFFKQFVLVLAFSLGINASGAQLPEKISFSSPKHLGLSAVCAEKSTVAPVLDGTVLENEYNEKNTLTPSYGLTIATGDGGEGAERKRDAYKNIKETVSVFYDDWYFYISMELIAPDGNLAPYCCDPYGDVFLVSVSLGLDEGADPVSCQAVLNNNYYYSLDSSSVVAVSGVRLRKQGNALKNTLQISSSVKMFQNKGFVDDENVLWNGEKYCEEASAVLNDDFTKLSFQCRIPVGDVLLCLEETQRTDAFLALKNDKAFCGSFLSQISVGSLTDDTPLLAVSGLSAKSVCPYSETGESWNEVLVSDFGLSQETSYAIDWIMSPLFFGGKQEEESADATDSIDTSDLTDRDLENKTNQGDACDSVGDLSGGESEKLEKTQNESVSVEGLVEDESIFDHLPDAEDPLPEHTEIIPIETDAANAESSTSFGSVLPFFAGILMLASVFIIAYVFFRKEKEEKNAKKSKKKTG